MLKQILVGLLVSGGGGVLIVFSQNLVEIFGSIPWAEKNMGTTKSAYVLGGFVVMVLGFLILFGMVPLGSPMDTTGNTELG